MQDDTTGMYTLPPVTNSVWLLTKLQTPCGDTTFDYFHPTWPLFTAYGVDVDNHINRAITVTQPDGGKHLFLYSDLGNSQSSQVTSYPSGCSSGGFYCQL